MNGRSIVAALLVLAGLALMVASLYAMTRTTMFRLPFVPVSRNVIACFVGYVLGLGIFMGGSAVERNR